jgi:hypothetical protein
VRPRAVRQRPRLAGVPDVEDADDEEPVEAVVLCPDCAAREFGAPPVLLSKM